MSRNKKKILISSLVVVAFALCTFLLPLKNVLATDRTIVAKAVYEGVWNCFKNGAYISSFMASNPDGFIKSEVSNEAVMLPYKWTSVSDNNLNCDKLMFGGEGFPGMLPSNAKNENSPSSVAKYFAGNNLDGNGGIGYKATAQKPQTQSTAERLIIKIPDGNDKDPELAKLCGGGGKIATPQILDGGGKIVFPLVVKSPDGKGVVVSSSDTEKNVPTQINGAATFRTPCGSIGISVQNVSASTNENVLKAFNYHISSDGWYMDITNDGSGWTIPQEKIHIIGVNKDGADTNLDLEVVKQSVPINNPDDFISDYKLDFIAKYTTDFVGGINANNASGYKMSDISYDNLALTKKQVYDLYTYYIKDVFKADVACEGSADYQNYPEDYINWQGGIKCKVNKSSACGGNDPNNYYQCPDNVYGVKNDRHFGIPLDLDGVINGLASLGDLSDITGKKDPKKDDPKDPDDPTNPDDPSNPDTPKEAETSDYEKCDDMMDKGLKSGEKIGSMQWILCPSMDNSVYAADWVDRMTDDWLSMDPTTYNADSVKVAWDAIRNISNILMIVFLLVIIFSQLTGYGIDNYGIKKMLPRLIVMAIVINMSWYICVMAADLSNIFGVSLRNLFAAIGNGLPAQLGSGDPDIAGTSYAAGAAVGMFAAAGSGGSAAVGAGITAASLGASAAVAIIIAVIVLALIILVAVMILFLMLGVRLIIVIICIILSPLAFASFVLPNTQNFFKKWWDAYKAALIIYPICGMLSGISHLLRNIFSEMGDVPIAVSAIAMIMPYLGFFLIPTLLKSAIAALGKFGGALTSMGNTIRNGGRAMGHAAAGAVKNSEGYKNMQNETARRRQQQSAERTIKKLEKMKEGGALNDAQTRRLARAHETIRKLGNEDQAARTILADKEYAGLALTSNDPNQRTLMGDWKEAWRKGDTAKMNALTDVIIARHGPGGANEIAGALAGEEIFDDSGNFVSKEAEASFNAIRINMQQNSAFSGAMQGKASDAYQMISGGGYYTDGNGVTKRGNLAAHSQYNSIATQAKDWATQSGATLKRAAAAGAFTQRQALELLNSTDPAVQSGIQTDASKRQVLEAVANGGHVDWNDKDSIQAASINYQHGQALIENAEYDRRMAEQQQQAVNPPVHAPINRPTTGQSNNPDARGSVDVNIDHHGDGADEIPE